jgi:cysteine-rich repeat protein
MTGLAGAVLALGATLAAGCLADPSQRCADGTLCPADTSCLPDGGCASAAQLAACDGLADGEPCSFPGAPDGTCAQGACVAAACGNGIVDQREACDAGPGNSLDPDATCRPDCAPPRCGDGVVDPGAGEVCDDGNLDDGDGCRFDCASDETCGNGAADYAVGEACDDGDPWDGDGCASTCAAEVPVWRSASSIGVAACDELVATGDGVVCFSPPGGFGPELTRRYRAVGPSLTYRDLTSGPSRRYDYGLAYDAERRVVVLFGGYSLTGDNAHLGDTWEFDGEVWIERTPAGAPTPRSGAAMAYDAARQRVVMFGGEVQVGMGLTATDELWEYDGDTWTLIDVEDGPGARQRASAVYAPSLGGVVMIGGFAGDPEITWRWDGASWTQLPVPALTIPGGYPGCATYDHGARALVVAAGNLGLWQLDGGSWTQRPTPLGTAPRSMAYDTHVDRLLVHDGAYFVSGDAVSEYIGPAGDGSTSLLGGAAAYDERRGEVVAWGGNQGDATYVMPLGERSALRRPTAATPPARYATALAYHRGSDRVVLFGGGLVPSGTLLGDTWLWDGASWTQAVTPTAPSPRLWPAMASAPERGSVVLYGGYPGGAGLANDTWEWDGRAWRQVDTPTRPPTRSRPAFAHDRGRGRTVLFGGAAANGALLADTWEYDGTDWRERTSAVAPPARQRAAMVEDLAVGQVLLFGGNDGTGVDALADTWLWDGTSWTEAAVGALPTGPEDRALVHHAASRRTVTFAAYDVLWFGFELPGLAGEQCDGVSDGDDDGARGCDDADCWGRCAPWCPPSGPCDAAGPRCGDGACTPPLESRAVCPEDCAGAGACGDGACQPDERTSACPLDCAACGDLICGAPVESSASCAEDCP